MRAIVGVLIAATLAVGSGCAKTDWIDRTLVTVDVTGSWYGSVESVQTAGGVPDLFFELEQQGSTVKGFVRFSTGQAVAAYARVVPGPIEGTVAGDVFRFKQTTGSLEGELTVSGDEMNGRVSFGSSRPCSLRRVSPR